MTRELTEDLAGLVKKIDALVEKNSGKQMRSFVVLLTDDPDAAEKQLKDFAKKHGISKGVPLTFFDGVAGPPKYKITKDAALTIMLWRNQNVVSNHAYGKGAFNGKAAQVVVDATSKILN